MLHLCVNKINTGCYTFASNVHRGMTECLFAFRVKHAYQMMLIMSTHQKVPFFELMRFPKPLSHHWLVCSKWIYEIKTSVNNCWFWINTMCLLNICILHTSSDSCYAVSFFRKNISKMSSNASYFQIELVWIQINKTKRICWTTIKRYQDITGQKAYNIMTKIRKKPNIKY